MNKGRLFQVIAASLAILLGAAAASAAMALGMGYGTPPPASQQPPAPQMSGKPSNSSNTVRPEIAKPAKEAIELAKKQDYQNALAKAKEADAAVTDKTPYEEYVVAKLVGVYSGQLHDSAAAATAFNRAVASNGAPQEELSQVLGITLGANIDAKNYAQAVSDGEQLQKLGPLDAASSENLAVAYYSKGDYPNALKTARATIDLQSNNGGKPDQQTLIIVMNSQVKTGDQAGAKQTLAKLCSTPSPPPDLKCGPVGKQK